MNTPLRLRWLALVPVCLTLACVDPADRRPGLRLSGEVVEGPVDDWSFTSAHREILLETRTPYLIPHSVTIICADQDGRLFVGARDPESKRWVGYVARDDAVRLKIGERVYEQRLVPIEDPARREAVYRAYAAKYGWESTPPANRPPVAYYEVVERT